MALTISDHPVEVIGNDAQFQVDTDLTEGGSYQNLRIRATLYIGGHTSAVAVLEQPDGLNVWDFFDLLKSFTGKCDTDIGGSAIHTEPSLSSELLTGWSNLTGWETFTTSGREITAAADTNASGADGVSNDLGSAVCGDVYIMGLESDFDDTGAQAVNLAFGNVGGTTVYSWSRYAGRSGGELIANHLYPFMCTGTVATPAVHVYNLAGGNAAFDGTFTVRKITDFKNNPGVYYMITFEEVYENASNVTTIGDDIDADTLLFIPGVADPGVNWNSDYVIDGTGKKFISRLEDGHGVYLFNGAMELRMMYASVAPYVRVEIDTDAGTQDDYFANPGWGMVIVNNTGSGVDADDTTIDVTLRSVEDDDTNIYIGATLTITCDLLCYNDVRALTFVGQLGGEETIVFRGLHTLEGQANKKYYKNVNGVRLVLKATKYFSMILRALYETEGVKRLIHEAVYTEQDVWLQDTDENSGYKLVTVVSDSAMITNRNELIEPELGIEYYE